VSIISNSAGDRARSRGFVATGTSSSQTNWKDARTDRTRIVRNRGCGHYVIGTWRSTIGQDRQPASSGIHRQMMVRTILDAVVGEDRGLIWDATGEHRTWMR
jgi:hypothetical protein